jgi:hypothetical protein
LQTATFLNAPNEVIHIFSNKILCILPPNVEFRNHYKNGILLSREGLNQIKSKKINQNKMKKTILGLMAFTIILSSCGGGAAKEGAEAESKVTETHYTAADLVDFDLSTSGIPLVTKAPKDARVIKSTNNKDITVYGGKFFKVTFSEMDGTAEENISSMKSIVSDKELNPSFEKFEAEDKNGFLKINKEGKLAFSCFYDANGKTILAQEGMQYDLSPDQFSDYSAEDVKLMFEAAKATKAK